jgi:hypothetical protein
MAAQHRAQPLALLGNRAVHASPGLDPQLFELANLPLALRLPFDDEPVRPGLSRRAAGPRDGSATHMAFESRHGLGLCDLTNYVAQSHTPQAHCVRFGRAVTGRTRNTRYQAAR